MLSIDGVHIENDLGLYLLQDSDETALPQVRENSVTIPGRHGAYSFDSYLEPRQFFEYILIPTQATLNDVQKIVRKVSTLLLDQYGKPKEVKLVFDYEPDKFYKAKFSGFISINRIAKAGIFPIPFKAYDPFAYSESNAYDQDPILYDVGKQYDDGIMYQNKGIVNWTNSRHYSGVHNYLLYTTPFSFMIEGRVINPKMTNLTTGKSFSLDIVLGDDERLYIDSEKQQAWKIKTRLDANQWSAPKHSIKSISKWVRMNMYKGVKGEFPQLVQGDNGFLFEGTLPNATINFNWQHKSM